jgi:hypothetical protein
VIEDVAVNVATVAGEIDVRVTVEVNVDVTEAVGEDAVFVGVGEDVAVGVGVVCAKLAAPSEKVERIRIAKTINLLTD